MVVTRASNAATVVTAHAQNNINANNLPMNNLNTTAQNVNTNSQNSQTPAADEVPQADARWPKMFKNLQIMSNHVGVMAAIIFGIMGCIYAYLQYSAAQLANKLALLSLCNSIPTYSNTTQCQNIRLPGVRHKRDLDYESISGTNLLQSEAFFSLCAVSLIFLNYTLYYRFCLCQNLRQKVPLAGAMAVVVDVQVKVAVSAQKAHGNLLEIVHLVILDTKRDKTTPTSQDKPTINKPNISNDSSGGGILLFPVTYIFLFTLFTLFILSMVTQRVKDHVLNPPQEDARSTLTLNSPTTTANSDRLETTEYQDDYALSTAYLSPAEINLSGLRSRHASTIKPNYALKLRNRLYEATMTEDIVALDYTITAGANINETLQGGKTALGYIIESGNHEMLSLLLDSQRKCVDLGVPYTSDAGDQKGFTAFHTAIMSEELDIVKILADRSISSKQDNGLVPQYISGSDYRSSVFFFTLQRRCLPVMKCLLGYPFYMRLFNSHTANIFEELFDRREHFELDAKFIEFVMMRNDPLFASDNSTQKLESLHSAYKTGIKILYAKGLSELDKMLDKMFDKYPGRHFMLLQSLPKRLSMEIDYMYTNQSVTNPGRSFVPGDTAQLLLSYDDTRFMGPVNLTMPKPPIAPIGTRVVEHLEHKALTWIFKQRYTDKQALNMLKDHPFTFDSFTLSILDGLVKATLKSRNPIDIDMLHGFIHLCLEKSVSEDETSITPESIHFINTLDRLDLLVICLHYVFVLRPLETSMPNNKNLLQERQLELLDDLHTWAVRWRASRKISSHDRRTIQSGENIQKTAETYVPLKTVNFDAIIDDMKPNQHIYNRDVIVKEVRDIAYRNGLDIDKLGIKVQLEPVSCNIAHNHDTPFCLPIYDSFFDRQKQNETIHFFRGIETIVPTEFEVSWPDSQSRSIVSGTAKYMHSITNTSGCNDINDDYDVVDGSISYISVESSDLNAKKMSIHFPRLTPPLRSSHTI